MTFCEHLSLIKRLDYFISIKGTGPAKAFAEKIGVSRASLYRYLDDLKSLGASVGYCRERQSFYYEEPFDLGF